MLSEELGLQEFLEDRHMIKDLKAGEGNKMDKGMTSQGVVVAMVTGLRGDARGLILHYLLNE